jgi:hypothetical protein
MTTQARVVVADCREAHRELMLDPVGAQWRLRWTTMVTLLRIVLHVLRKVDANWRSPGLTDI